MVEGGGGGCSCCFCECARQELLVAIACCRSLGYDQLLATIANPKGKIEASLACFWVGAGCCFNWFLGPIFRAKKRSHFWDPSYCGLRQGSHFQVSKMGPKMVPRFVRFLGKLCKKMRKRGSGLAGGFLVLLGLVGWAVGCCCHELAQLELPSLLPFKPRCVACIWHTFTNKRAAQQLDCGGPLRWQHLWPYSWSPIWP